MKGRIFGCPEVGDGGARRAAATLVLSSRHRDGRKRGTSWREAMVTSTAVATSATDAVEEPARDTEPPGGGAKQDNGQT